MPKHDDATSIPETHDWHCRGDVYRAHAQPRFVSTFRAKHNEILSPRHRFGQAQHYSGHAQSVYFNRTSRARAGKESAHVRVYDEAGNVIETHEQAEEFKEW
jgi:hypothetical protein